MDVIEKEFWEIISESSMNSNRLQEQQVFFKTKVSAKPLNEQLELLRVAYQLLARVNLHSLTLLLELIEPIPSDQDFLYFRSWIIMKGKDFFESVTLSEKFNAIAFLPSVENEEIYSYYACDLLNIVFDQMKSIEILQPQKLSLYDLFIEKYENSIIKDAMSFDKMHGDQLTKEIINNDFNPIIQLLLSRDMISTESLNEILSFF
jgi:hypothetical protein